PDQIILFGYSLGGYLVARAAAFDHRVAAIVLNDGVFDFYGAFAAALPGFLKKWIDEKNDRAANRVIRMLARRSTRIRWAINNGLWVMGVESPAQYIRMTKDYTIADVAGSITCPTLILDADNDAFFKGQPQQVAAAIGGPATLTTLSDSEGAGEHCHVGAMSRLHQEMFDWLDDTVLTPALESRARLSHRA
ncbi:MAG: alpha/beta fold hydrolase, partial [Lacisediminihabitans sp.]